MEEVDVYDVIFNSPNICENIFQYFSVPFLCHTISLVSKQWKYFSKTETLWKIYCETYLQKTINILPNEYLSWFQYYQFLDIWKLDCSITPNQVNYLSDYSCLKLDNFVDINYVLTKKAFTKGKIAWQIKIYFKGDEMRIGFTNNKTKLLEKKFYTLHEPHLWCYSDGSRNKGFFNHGHLISGNLESYGNNDVIFVKKNN